jgi:YgiT-type zinc finger domain-containing protein
VDRFEKQEDKMNTETFEEQKVTYTLELNGKFYIIENVPARVCSETGEQLFAPAVVEKIQQMILGNQPPKRMAETPVFEFAA